jgi:hypothetical protein
MDPQHCFALCGSTIPFSTFPPSVLSADIIKNSAVGNFSPKTEGTKTKAAIVGSHTNLEA